ncbi:MAG: methyltransferase [Candidatus Methanomethylicaceae archaeon]|jgi:16S rRNA (guanine1207-N2)-methyltransferase
MTPGDRKERASHYYSKNPPRDQRRFSLRLDIKGKRIELASSGGIFSKSKVDRGTIVLLESMILPEEGEVLDMGCGCGVIGIAVSKFRPKLKVTMVDVNPLAVRLSKENAESNNISNSTVMQSDLYASLEGRQFDLILSNPPLAAGYKVIFPLIEGAKSRLKEGCSLQIVLRKGVNAIPKKMANVFGNVDLISKKSGYRVFRSIRQA